MKIGTGENYLRALPVSPKPDAAPLEPALTGLGKIEWTSPLLAKALEGSALGAMTATANIYALPAQKTSLLANVQHGAEFLDDSGFPINEMLKGIAEEAVKSKQLSAAGGTLFKCTVAGAQIYLEVTHPSDKSLLEKLLSIGSHGLDLAEPLVDWVPHLSHAKPYLMAIVKIKDEVQAVVQYRATEAQALLPAGSNAFQKPARTK